MGVHPDEGQPTPSCRLDWLSLSAFAATASLQRQQLAYVRHISEAICPGAPFTPGAGRRFYANAAVCEASGIQVRWTEPGTGGNNDGGLNVDLTGTTFKYLTPEERVAIYLDFAELEGFKHCTRLDAQRTLIEPEADAEQIYRMVLNREIWVARFESYSQLGPVDSKGDAVKGASVCWGQPMSARRGMTYNKALEDKWPGVRAVRHEVRNRKAVARDLFKTLIAEIRSAPESEQTSVESRFAQSVLGNSMTYLDTTRFAAIQDKKEWPENWAADSQPAPFWNEVVTGEPIEIQTQWRVTKSLEDSQFAEDQQYGRKRGQWSLWQRYAFGKTFTQVALERLEQAILRMKPEDLDKVAALLTPEQAAQMRAEWTEVRQVAANNVENGTRQTYDMGTHG